MNNASTSSGEAANKLPGFLILLVVLLVTLGILFSGSFVANQVLFSNDGPLGAIGSQATRMTPGAFRSVWQDLNWLGNEGITPDASLSAVLAMVLQPLYYAKFASPIGLLVLGFCAWVFFRQLRLAPWACVIGAVATSLNSDFFSTSAWGIVPQPICVGACFLALAAMARISESTSMRAWARVALAGFAVGMAVVHGADVGALFSLFVAAYVFYQALFLDDKASSAGRKIAFGVARLALVTVCAIFIATHTLASLVGTQIQGVAGLSEDQRARDAHYAFSTEWSLPKIEILQAVIPGIFGYRQNWHMYDDFQPKDDQYWGLIGADPSQNFWRLSGTGLYAGVLVWLVALWAILQSLRNAGSPFTTQQRRAIWFWTAVLAATALLGFGKFGPVYQFFYALPYAPSIRNPTKFMHIFSWALVIVFAYGAHGLVTAYMRRAVDRATGAVWSFGRGWSKLVAFDRAWLIGCILLIGLAIIGRLIYGSESDQLRAYLPTVGIPDSEAGGVAQFSLHSLDTFIVILVVTVGLLGLIITGLFSAKRAALGGGLILLLLVLDLGRADAPWIVYWNTDYKYGSDPITKFLADKPYEHRVSFLQLRESSQQYQLMNAAYYSQWKQHVWPYNNIQCAESIQEPRVSVDKTRFEGALPFSDPKNLVKTWELLNVRYLLAPVQIAGNGQALDILNQLDPANHPFKTATFPDGKPVRFNFEPKSSDVSQSAQPVDYNPVPDPNGQLQVVEFTGALPRASLFATWQVNSDDASTLATISSASFDPHQYVIVSNAIAPPKPEDAGKPAGSVEIKDNYQPKRVELEADVKVPAVLLLCDRYNPKWKVTVDGRPAELLRCDYIERGVLLQPGKHEVVFQFTGSYSTLMVSVAAVVIALGLCSWLAFTEDLPETPVETPAAGNPVQSDSGKSAESRKNKTKK